MNTEFFPDERDFFEELEGSFSLIFFFENCTSFHTVTENRTIIIKTFDSKVHLKKIFSIKIVS